MADSKLKQIRLVIADDQSIDLAGVKALLRDVQGIDVVGEADIATKVSSVVSELKPNVLLLDLKWHGNSRMGLRLIEEVRQNSPEVKIIAQTNYENLVDEALDVGANAAVTKSYSRDRLVHLIQGVCGAVPAMTNTPNTSRSELTDREMQVLRLLAAGKTDKEIGRDLGISSNTVRRHVTAIYEKLQVSGRAQAVQRAYQMRLVTS